MVVFRRNAKGELVTQGSGKTQGGKSVKIWQKDPYTGKQVDVAALSSEEKIAFNEKKSIFYAAKEKQRAAGLENAAEEQLKQEAITRGQEIANVQPTAQVSGQTAAAQKTAVSSGAIPTANILPQAENIRASLTEGNFLEKNKILSGIVFDPYGIQGAWWSPLSQAEKLKQKAIASGNRPFITISSGIYGLIDAQNDVLKSVSRTFLKTSARYLPTTIGTNVEKLNIVRNQNKEVMKALPGYIGEGIDPATATERFNQLEANISEAESLMKEISKDPLAFSKDEEIFKALVEFEQFRTYELESLRIQLEQAKNNYYAQQGGFVG